jgi:hypothetical protein
VLDRILEKGLVVAGDVRISLAEVELLTIRIRLIVCSIDKAQAIGLDWWRNDPYFSSQRGDQRTLTVGDGALPARRRTGSRPGRSEVPAAVRRRRRGGE